MTAIDYCVIGAAILVCYLILRHNVHLSFHWKFERIDDDEAPQ